MNEQPLFEKEYEPEEHLADNLGEDELFADEEPIESSGISDTWKIMIVDDEEDVHIATRLALEHEVFEGKILTILDAYSAKEACQILGEHSETALILLDVVMEAPHAGLEFVKYVRDFLRNQFVRIIVQTGQPGYAPEQEVVGKYDINDYRIKLEMSSDKLFTVVATGIRTYKAMKLVDAYNQELEREVQARTSELVAMNQQLQQEIIEHKQAQVELQKAKEAADAANLAKSEFLANMSHELRTPLNAVLGYAQILQNAENLTERQKEAIKTIKNSGEHLLNLINDILNFSKVEAGHMELRLSEFHFPEFLDHLAGMVRIRADQKRLTFVYERAPDLPIGVRADEKKLRQVLLNLLGNAVKFTEKGSVTFRVKRMGRWGDGEMGKTAPHPLNSPSPRLPVSPSPHLRFEVEDTGIGIASEKLEEIFLPFQQISEKCLSVEGTGLGLTISQQLAKMMGSDLQVESTIDKGSIFWFELDLPVVEGIIPGAAEPSRKIIGYTGARRTVLVVDDNQENRNVLVNILLPLGFRFAEAKNGQECLDKTVKLKPDLILLDIRMPVMDGFKTAKRIRNYELKIKHSQSSAPNSQFLVPHSQFHTPIIAVSANVFEAARKRALAIGFDDFLIKPFQMENLLELLHTYLQLEWIYEEVEEQAGVAFPAPPSSQSIVPFPSEEVDVLLKLAERGNVKRILERLNHIESLAEKFQPLATELRTLAKSFQVDKIVEILEKTEEKT